MRSPRAVSSTAKLLILLAIGTSAQFSPAAAATKCPSGQILRISQGVCVPKAQNLSLLSRHVAKPKPAKAPAARSSAPEPAEEAAARRNRASTPPVEMAERDTPPAAEPRSVASPVEDDRAPLAAFGSLFVGAFHSTMSMGAAAFK